MKIIHKTADVSEQAILGDDVKIWNWVQIRERVKIGDNTIISKGVYIDFEVSIGSNCKIQNNVSIYHGVTIEDGVFLGPHVCFTNDKVPRAIDSKGILKGGDDWIISPINIKKGASVGAHSVILPGVEIGTYAMIGSGSVVTKDIPDHALVFGNPAKLHGWVCQCGKKVHKQYDLCQKCQEKERV